MANLFESGYLREEAEDAIRQINELRELLRACWSLVPDGAEGEKIPAIKRGMTKFECWPEL